MFRDGNNQAMGFVMQGYSDTIKVNQDKSLGNSFRDFNKSMSDSLDTYHKIEANKSATKAQQLQNEYSQKTMNDRVGLVGQELRNAKLTNDYSQRTMDDRIGMVEQKHKAIQHQNDITARTKDAQVASMNAGYIENKANSDYNTTIKNLEHEVYKSILPAEKDDKGNYWIKQYKDGKETGRIATNEAEYNRRKAINERAPRAKYTVNENERMKRESAMYGNMANASMNAINLRTTENFNQAQQNTFSALEDAGVSREHIIKELYGNGKNYIDTPMGQLPKAMFLQPVGYSSTINSGVTTNVITSNLPVIKTKANATSILRDEKSSEEEKQQARFILQQSKEYREAVKTIYDGASVLTSFEILLKNNRLDDTTGVFTRYFDGGKEFTLMDAHSKKLLVQIGTASMKGSLSDRDLDIVKKLIPSLWESQAAAMGKMHAGLTTILDKIEGDIYALGEAGYRVLPPEVLQKYNAIKSFYEAISLKVNVEK